MTGVHSLEWRAAAGVLCAVISAVVWWWAPRLRIDRAKFRRLAVLVFAVTRFSGYAAAFGLLRLQPRGDVELYLNEAAGALAGGLVYRDFKTPHAPLSPYLFSAMQRLHHGPYIIILFAMLFDIAAFAVWLRFSAKLPDALSERRAALLMIVNPVSLITVAIDGQMNSLIALGIAWSAVAAFERRDAMSGAAFAIPGVMVKFLSWVFAPVLWMASRRKLLWCAGFFALTAAVYGTFATAGANVLAPLGAEGAHKTSSNLTYLFELTSGINLGDRLPDAALAAAWIAVTLLPWRAMQATAGNEDARRRVLLTGLTAVMMAVQVFSKNTWDRYLVMTMFPLCWLAAEFKGAQMALYCAWSVVNVVYRSAWSSLAAEAPSLVMHRALAEGNPLAWWMLAGELLQTAGNAAILVFAVHRLVRSARDKSEQRKRPRPVLQVLQQPSKAA